MFLKIYAFIARRKLDNRTPCSYQTINFWWICCWICWDKVDLLRNMIPWVLSLVSASQMWLVEQVWSGMPLYEDIFALDSANHVLKLLKLWGKINFCILYHESVRNFVLAMENCLVQTTGTTSKVVIMSRTLHLVQKSLELAYRKSSEILEN